MWYTFFSRVLFKGFNFIPIICNKEKTRNNPYPPNFNKIPAKIIDPETGAST